MSSEILPKSDIGENRMNELFSGVVIPDPTPKKRPSRTLEPIHLRPIEDHPDLPYVPALDSKLLQLTSAEIQPSSLDRQEFNNAENATIESLRMQRYRVGLNTEASQVDDAFRNSPDLIGVIVQDQGRIHGVISRRRFYELLGKTFGVSIFMHRSIEFMLNSLGSQDLVVPSTSLIAETVDLALNRPIHQIYDPILVNFPADQYYLLDIYTLLLAQTNLFAVLREQVQQVNEELELRVRIRTAELQQEVVVRRRTEDLLQVRLRYEKTLNQCANVLLTGGDSHETIQDALTFLIDVVGSSRVFVLDHVEIKGIGPCLKLRNQVNSADILPLPDQVSVFPDSIWGDWFKTLWRGIPVIGQRDRVDARVGKLLQEIDIYSILLIPIGEPGNWIGAVGFGETNTNRVWDENEIQLLNTIAQLLYAYFERRRSVLVLADARDEALRASEFKSELLAKVSHELRTPLGAVLGYAQLLLLGSYGEMSDEQKGAAEVVISSTKYLATLVNGILDQAQLESGQLTLVSQRFNIRQMAGEIDARIRVLAEMKRLQFEVLFREDLPEEMVGDQIRIQQVLINILGNAIKFTDCGSIRMIFGMTQGRFLYVEISDTGAGIPADAQAKIFEPFMQVDGTPTRRYSGTGLGLSISKQLVGMMNGRIRLKSNLGKGSTFTVEIPIEST